MRLLRRDFLRLAAGALALPAAPGITRAQTYPSRPVRWVVPYPPGGPNDIAARLMGQSLSERLGVPFVMENRPGAGSNLGTEAVVRAAPDGYTLLTFSTAQAINATLYSKLGYNFIRDIVPIAGINREAMVVVVNPSFPAQTVSDFISYARSHPGKVHVASAGSGTAGHVFGELLKMKTGIDMVHVPYRGGLPALTDVMSGHVQAMICPISNAMAHVRSGKVRLIAATTTERLQAFPEIPTVAEFVPGTEGSFWSGLGAPSGTPHEVIDRLNQAINASLADQDMLARLADLGSTALSCSPAELGRLVADETEKWAKVVKFAGISVT